MKISIIFILIVIFSIQDQCSADGGAGAIGLSPGFNPIQNLIDWISGLLDEPKPTNNNEKNSPPNPPEIRIQIEENDKTDFDKALERWTRLFRVNDEISIKRKDCIDDQDYIKYPPDLNSFKKELNESGVCYNSIIDTYSRQIQALVNDCEKYRKQELRSFESIQDLKVPKLEQALKRHDNLEKQVNVLFRVLNYALYAQANTTSLLANLSKTLSSMELHVTSFQNVISKNTQGARNFKEAYRSRYMITTDVATGTEYRYLRRRAVFKPFQDLDKLLRKGEENLQKCLSEGKDLKCYTFIRYIHLTRSHISELFSRIYYSEKDKKPINWRNEMIELNALLSRGDTIKFIFDNAIKSEKKIQECLSEFIKNFSETLQTVAENIKKGLQY